jgi:hypothetical protein
MRLGKAYSGHRGAAARAFSTVVPLMLAMGITALAAGCSSISTPLPDGGPTGSIAMSAKDSKQAVEELAKKRDTHQQDAEKEIEQSR